MATKTNYKGYELEGSNLLHWDEDSRAWVTVGHVRKITYQAARKLVTYWVAVDLDTDRFVSGPEFRRMDAVTSLVMHHKSR